MRSAAGLFYAAVFAFVSLADAGHGSKTLNLANKCAVGALDSDLRVIVIRLLTRSLF